MYIECNNFFQLYQEALGYVFQHGYHSAPRGKETVEVCGCTLRLTDARSNLLTSTERKLNYYFSIAEWLWILLGREDVETIAAFNKNIRTFSDNEVDLSGAYGPRFVDQLPYVIRKLTHDSDSRQAVITLWQPKPQESKDIPCTIMLHYMIREGKLNAITYMRSNDLWLGFPYDVFNFTQLQAYVAQQLDVVPGWYEHHVGSLHYYVQDVDGVERVVNEVPKAYYLPLSYQLTELPRQKLKEFFVDIAMNGVSIAKGDHHAYAARIRNELPEPWSTYVLILLTRFTRSWGYVSEPWDYILDRCCLLPLSSP